MSILRFETAPVRASEPNRADIALFVGFVAPRAPADAATLLDVPVPIESWSTFDALFAWDARPLEGDPATAATYLGAAVRSFFAEGGRKCYVVRVGEPWPLPRIPGAALDAAPAAPLTPEELRRRRFERIAALIPGFPGAAGVDAADASTWRGAGWLLGLPDVSFLSLPDLPDAAGAGVLPGVRPVALPPVAEQFVECSAGGESAVPDTTGLSFRAPRCDAEAYTVWSAALERLVDVLEARAREVQLVASLPLPEPGSREEATLPVLVAGGAAGTALGAGTPRGTLASAFLQLAFPWASTSASARLPEGLEAPEGSLVGVLARNALARGTYRSAAGLPLADVHAVFPALPRAQLEPAPDGAEYPTLAERVTLLGRTPAGMRLLSDVTLSAVETYRPANVNRLVAALVRAARRLGESVVFEPSAEALWGRLRAQLETLLLGLYRDGALRGATPAEAFQVRCDRSTMRQADIDAGRCIAEVQFEAAAPIERITVVLALDTTGDVVLLAASATRVAA